MCITIQKFQGFFYFPKDLKIQQQVLNANVGDLSVKLEIFWP